MFGKQTHRGWFRGEVVIAVAALLAGLIVSQAFAASAPPTRKMSRQVDVMEKIVDQVLIDSPNFLVSGRGTTRGLFIPDYGVVFTFSASLVNKGTSWNFDFGDGFKVYTEEGRRIVVLDPDIDEDYDDGDLGDGDREEFNERRSRRDRGDKAQARLYGRGKAELVDVFLDYGDTLTSIDGDHWVSIVAFLRDSSYFSEARISHLALKAKASDLRAYASEDLTEQEMVKRIVEEEY